MKNNKTISNSIYNLIRTIGIFLFPVITFSYISRIFQAEGMGRVNFAKSFIGFFSMIAMLGIRYYGIRECAKRRDDKEELSRVFGELLLFNLISTFAAYVILYLFLCISVKANEYRVEIGLYSITMFLTVIGVEWLFIAVEDYKYLAVRSIIIQVITLLAVLLLVHGKEDIYLYIIIQVVSNLIVYASGLIYARRYIGFMKPRPGNLAVHLKPVMYLFLVMMSVEIFTNMNTVMLGYLSGDVQVGCYSAAYKMSAVICSFVSAVTTVIMPRIAYLLKNENEDKAKELLKKAVQFILMVDIPICVGACIYSRNFIFILCGGSFAAAIPASMILAMRSLLSPINGMLLTHYMIPRDREKEAIIITSLTAVFNIILNALLIPSFGAVGAAISTVCSEMAEMILIFVFVRSYLNVRTIFSKGYQYLLCVIPVILIAVGTGLLIDNVVISVILGVIIAVPVYFLLLYHIRNEYLLEGITLIRDMLKDKD